MELIRISFSFFLLFLSLTTRQRKRVSRTYFSTTGSRERGLTPLYQKCDANQPCTACVDRDSSAECTYELRQRSHPAGTGMFFAAQTSPPNVPDLLSQAFTHVPSNGRTSPPRDLPLITWSVSSESASSRSQSLAPCGRPPTPTMQSPQDFSPHIYDEIPLGPSPDVSITQKAHDTAKYIPRPIVSSFTVLPSIHFQPIPRPLRPPFSLIPPERVQVSSVAESDLEMTLYVFSRFHQILPVRGC